MYRFTRGRASRGCVSYVLVAVVAAYVVGCASTPEPPEDVEVAGKSDAEILYAAIVESFRERGLAIEHKSFKFRVVTSQYRPVSDRLRRRFTARIVPLPGGANALRVEAQHQRRHGDDEGGVWKEVDSDALDERSASDELDLGRAIERRYRRWRTYADERDDGEDGDDEDDSSETEDGDSEVGADSDSTSDGESDTREETEEGERER